MGDSATTFITFLGSLVTAVLDWLGELITFIMDKPLILIPMLIFFIVGGVIGLMNRLVRG